MNCVTASLKSILTLFFQYFLVTRPANIHIQVQGNILKQEQPKTAWLKNFGSTQGSHEGPLAPIPFSSQVWSQSGKAPGHKGFVVNMPSIESSFASHVARGPTNFLDPDYAALLVLSECLDTLEGPFWKQLRGSGAVYGANLRVDVEAGMFDSRLSQRDFAILDGRF